jgi:hypothetical protein
LIAARSPPYRGEPGSGRRWSIPMTGLGVAKMMGCDVGMVGMGTGKTEI